MTRRLSRLSRLRAAIRESGDRVLGADVAWSVLFFVASFLMVGAFQWRDELPEVRDGEVLTRNLVLPRDVEFVDHALTEQQRQQARSEVPDVYVFDPHRGDRAVEALMRLFRDGRVLQEDRAPDEALEALMERYGAMLPREALQTLLRHRFGEELERTLVEALQPVLDRPIVANKSFLQRRPKVTVVHLPGEREEPLSDFSEVLDLEEARRQVRNAVRRTLRLPSRDEGILADVAAAFVDANLSYDPGRTLARREAAAAAVPPVLVRIPAGTILARRGERVTPELRARLEAIRQAVSGRWGPATLAGLAALLALLAFYLYRYTRHHQRHFKKVRHLHALLVSNLLFMLALSLGLTWVFRAVATQMAEPFHQVDLYRYLVPLGAGAVMVALLATGRIATVYASFMAVLFGMAMDWSLHQMLWALLAQWGGIYAIATYRDRAALLRAGLVAGGAGALAALAVELVQGGADPGSRLLLAGAMAFAGGALGVGLLVSFALPLFEAVFDVLTDIRLLELSNINHPLLNQLVVRAPGTYNHSLVVGTLAEEAAKSIGANPLLCRVGAFYHDIGKILKPEYFVENMRGENPHEKLAPSMSALILISHVKEGIRLAREAGLPQQIIDLIPQHHGTRLMTYFYEKAKRQAEKEGGVVNEEEFRYPGPKPQTKEAAIFMLADAVEAASRTVDDPTPQRLEDMIRRVVNNIVLDGQLDECDLNFADLRKIQEAFLRVLSSFHHHRVDYPGFDFRKKGAKDPEGTPTESSEPAGAGPVHGGRP